MSEPEEIGKAIFAAVYPIAAGLSITLRKLIERGALTTADVGTIIDIVVKLAPSPEDDFAEVHSALIETLRKGALEA